MNYNLKFLHGKAVFVDANAFIYHLYGMSEMTKEVFKLNELGQIKLITTTRVIDEVFHKILLIRAKEKFNIEKKAIKKLRKDKEKVKKLAEDIKLIITFLNGLNLKIKEITKNDLLKLPNIMQKYGIFGNDALILIIMKKYNLKYLLSSDQNFKNIQSIELIKV